MKTVLAVVMLGGLGCVPSAVSAANAAKAAFTQGSLEPAEGRVKGESVSPSAAVDLHTLQVRPQDAVLKAYDGFTPVNTLVL